MVQVIKLINSEHGSKPIQLKLKVRSLFSPSRRFSFVCSYSCCSCSCSCLPIDEWC